MKRKLLIIFTVITALTSVFALCACNSKTSTDKLLRINWSSDGFSETFVYEASGKIGDEAVTGTLTITVSPETDGFSITRTQIMSNGDKIDGKVYFTNNGNFAPTESICTFSADGVIQTQKIVYDGKKVRFYSSDGDSVPADATPVEYDISSPYYDNMQFYTIIRGATFDKNYNLSFKTFVPNEGRVVTLTTALGATENVPYSIGENDFSVDCQRVFLSLNQSNSGGKTISVYYATTELTLSNGYKVKQVPIKISESKFTYTLTDLSASK